MKLTGIYLLFFSLFAIAFESSCQEKVVSDSSKVRMVNTSQNASIKCIKPPMGFDTLTGLNGYYHRDLGASIIISKVDGKTVKDAEAAFNDKHIENIKSTLLSKSWLKLDDGREMLVFHLTYDFKGETWGRYQAFVGDENTTLWIVISYPYKYSKDVEGVLLKSLRSVKFDER